MFLQDHHSLLPGDGQPRGPKSEVHSCMAAFFFMAWLSRVTQVISSVPWYQVRRR